MTSIRAIHHFLKNANESSSRILKKQWHTWFFALVWVNIPCHLMGEQYQQVKQSGCFSGANISQNIAAFSANGRNHFFLPIIQKIWVFGGNRFALQINGFKFGPDRFNIRKESAFAVLALAPVSQEVGNKATDNTTTNPTQSDLDGDYDIIWMWGHKWWFGFVAILAFFGGNLIGMAILFKLILPFTEHWRARRYKRYKKKHNIRY